MRFNQDLSLSHYSIRTYSDSGIQVVFPNHAEEVQGRDGPYIEKLLGSFILTPDSIIRDWLPNSLEELQASHFKTIVDLAPEVVLLGTGKTLKFPDLAITSDLIQQGIGVEVMGTAAACRTFNILMQEDRQVVAAIIQK